MERSNTLNINQWVSAKEAVSDEFVASKILAVSFKKGVKQPYLAKPSDFMYYVHFHGFNRRLDRWISFKDIYPIDKSGNPCFYPFSSSKIRGDPFSSLTQLKPPSSCLALEEEKSTKRVKLEGEISQERVKKSFVKKRIHTAEETSLTVFHGYVLYKTETQPSSLQHETSSSPLFSSVSKRRQISSNQKRTHTASLQEFGATEGSSTPLSSFSVLKPLCSSTCSTEEKLILPSMQIKDSTVVAVQEMEKHEEEYHKLALFDPTLTFSESEEDVEEHEGMDQQTIQAHEEATKMKTLNKIQIGSCELTAWYFSPLPTEFQNFDILYVCEWCLTFFHHQTELQKHSSRCSLRHPPGNEIYRDGCLSVFEVDGQCARVYTENLCFLSKLFLDHKTLQYEVKPFLFYILTESDHQGCHLVGYFSKEKYSVQGYNLACILTFPQFQRKGYGKFLVSLSYQLSLVEGRSGTPEKPLSDLGRLSYRAFWSLHLLDILENRFGKISIEELMHLTAINKDDIQRTLEEIGVLRYIQGQHLICLHPEVISQGKRLAGHFGIPLKKHLLHYVPFSV
ncbi:histone lysine acetyltransferase MYST-B [Cardiosporidium cionae]|uniref:Histone acetyltransferase n=1 Tax=Cardiosporidium cionae TaxID=476202 RepID=A0ABQ7J9N5_9APIC|nr:histone lysine acetyltransferase MYST-B [Cardiosporidium cionae]|eukprot:KAF8820669.1 histone lysine acetyltransferase MYST-B [Cardiosporidium cionae]